MTEWNMQNEKKQIEEKKRVHTQICTMYIQPDQMCERRNSQQQHSIYIDVFSVLLFKVLFCSTVESSLFYTHLLFTKYTRINFSPFHFPISLNARVFFDAKITHVKQELNNFSLKHSKSSLHHSIIQVTFISVRICCVCVFFFLFIRT